MRPTHHSLLSFQDGIQINLYDRFEMNYQNIEHIREKLNVLENRIGYGFISNVKSFKQLVKDCDVLIFLGECDR